MNKVKIFCTIILLFIAVVAAFANRRTVSIYYIFINSEQEDPVPIETDINCGSFGGQCRVYVAGIGLRQLFLVDPSDSQLKRVGMSN